MERHADKTNRELLELGDQEAIQELLQRLMDQLKVDREASTFQPKQTEPV